MLSTSALPLRTASSGLNVVSWHLWLCSFSALSPAYVPFDAYTVIPVDPDRVQIHFIFALSRFYAHLASGNRCDQSCTYDDDNLAPLERIYLLPHPPIDQNEKPAPINEASIQSPIYAPVPLSQVSPQIAHQLRATATEAWISRVPSYDIRSPPSVGPIHLETESY